MWDSLLCLSTLIAITQPPPLAPPVLPPSPYTLSPWHTPHRSQTQHTHHPRRWYQPGCRVSRVSSYLLRDLHCLPEHNEDHPDAHGHVYHITWQVSVSSAAAQIMPGCILPLPMASSQTVFVTGTRLVFSNIGDTSKLIDTRPGIKMNLVVPQPVATVSVFPAYFSPLAGRQAGQIAPSLHASMSNTSTTAMSLLKLSGCNQD